MAKEKGDWMQTMWRPAMGWLYMLVCFCDMIVFPVLWALWQGINHVPITQWNPLSLQGAGLFHIAMGAVLGIAAFGRTQEKLAGTAANPTNSSMSSIPSTTGSGFGGAGNGGFGSSAMGSAPTFGASTSGGFSGSGFGGSPSPTPAAGAGGFGGSSFGSIPSTTPTPKVTAPALDPSDPPARNTRNDG